MKYENYKNLKYFLYFTKKKFMKNQLILFIIAILIASCSGPKKPNIVIIKKGESLATYFPKWQPVVDSFNIVIYDKFTSQEVSTRDYYRRPDRSECFLFTGDTLDLEHNSLRTVYGTPNKASRRLIKNHEFKNYTLSRELRECRFLNSRLLEEAKKKIPKKKPKRKWGLLLFYTITSQTL